MPERNSKQEIRDGFHRELHNHIGLLKREFDKVETVVTNIHRLETNHPEIRALQELRDAKISLLRIRYYQEVDLIAKEFTSGIQEILDKDGLANNDLMNAHDSMDNGDGKYRKRRKREREDKPDDRKKKVSKKTDDKNTAPRRTPRKGAGKRKERSDRAYKTPDSAVQAAIVEQAKTFLSRKNEAKKSSDTDCDEGEKPKGQEKLHTKIKIQYTGNKKSLVVERIPSEERVISKSTASDEDENVGGPSQTAREKNDGERNDEERNDGGRNDGQRNDGKRNDEQRNTRERNEEGQGNNGQRNADETPRRSNRRKKETIRMKESKESTDTRRARR